MRFQSFMKRDEYGDFFPSSKAQAFQAFYLMNCLKLAKILGSGQCSTGIAYDIVGLPVRPVAHIWGSGNEVRVTVKDAGQFLNSIMKGMLYILADSWGVSPDCVECIWTGKESAVFQLFSQLSLVYIE